MTRRDRRRYDMLTRVRNFGTTHGQLFPATSTAHQALATVATELDRLSALDVAERDALQAASASRKRGARLGLVDTLTRAGLTARVLAKTNPHLDARIRLPLPKDDLTLLTIARQFAAGAAPCAGQFGSHGIPIAEVELSIATFEQALHQRWMGRDDRVKTRAEVEASFTRAMDAVEVLDVSVPNCLAAEPVALAVWKHDRYIEAPRRSGARQPQPVPTPVPEDPAPSADASSRPRTEAAAPVITAPAVSPSPLEPGPATADADPEPAASAVPAAA